MLELDPVQHPPISDRACGTKDVDQILADIRKDRSVRTDRGKIARTLPGQILDYDNDVTLVRTLFQRAGDPTGGAAYYAGFPLTAFREMMLAAAGIRVRVDGDWPDDVVVGSAGVPRIDAFRFSVESLRQAAATAIANPRTPRYQRHNLVTAYTTITLLTGSLHRFVRDPFHDPCLFLVGDSTAISADKAASQSHHTRLSPFGALLQAQLTHYQQHLRTLGDELLRAGDALAYDILDLLDTDRNGRPFRRRPRQLPFLFFLTNKNQLERVTFTSFQKVVGDWPWHPSAHRHLMSTLLREARVPAEYIDHVLGHWQAGDSPLGHWSILRADDYLLPVRDAIEKLLPELGFAELHGLHAHRPRQRRKMPSRIRPTTTPAFGPIARQEARSASQDQDKEVVESIWLRTMDHSLVDPTKTTRIPDELVREVRARISRRSAAYPERIQNQLLLLREHTMQLRSFGVDVLVPGIAYRPAETPPAVADLTGQSLQIAAALRAEFPIWLEEHAERLSSDKSGALAQGAALASAIILGGLRRKLWGPFISATFNGYFCHGGVEWLMLQTPDGDQRYLGDCVTRMLYSLAARLRREFPAEARTYSTGDGEMRPAAPDSSVVDDFDSPSRREPSDADDDIEEAAGHTEYHAAIAQVRTIVRESIGSQKLKDVEQAMADDLALRVSGTTRGWLVGHVPHVTLPNLAFARLMCGVRLAPEGTEVQADSSFPRAQPQRQYGDIQLKASHDFVEKLRAAVNDVADSESGDDKERSERNSAARRRIRSQVEALRKKLHPRIAPIVWHLVEHSEQLCTFGGARKNELSPATLSKYISPNAHPLLEAFGTVDPLDLPDEERAEFYAAALGPRSNNNSGRVERAYAMKVFDDELCRRHSLESIPWEDIEPGLLSHRSNVDANLLTRADLKRMSALSASDLDLSDEAMQWVPTLDRSLGHCGLRSGEAWRLDPDDDHGDEVLIRTSRRGSVKTRDRRALDIGPWIGFEREGAAMRPRTPRSAGASFKNSNEMSLAVSKACRLVTGDPSSRGHHGRHSYGSHLQVMATAVEHPLIRQALGSIPRVLTEMHQRLTGRAHRSARYIPAVAGTMGHAMHAGYDCTTQSTYMHVPEIVAAAELDVYAPRLKSAAIGHLTGWKAATLRSKINRLGADERPLAAKTSQGRRGYRSTGIPTYELLAQLPIPDVGLSLTALPDLIATVTPETSASLEPTLLVAALQMLHIGHPIEEVGNHLQVDAARLRATIGAASLLPTNYTFNFLGLQGATWSRDERFLSWSNASQRADAERELASVRKQFLSVGVAALRDLRQAFDSPTTLLKVASILCSCYRPSDDHWSTRTPISLNELKKSIESSALNATIALAEIHGHDIKTAINTPSSGIANWQAIRFGLTPTSSGSAHLLTTALGVWAAIC
ncbi:MAG: hypothetical protein M3O62_16600 [Pseudomonadota bacterium]|nr:hypothetical protein [Pseudomonadota bacterium]